MAKSPMNIRFPPSQTGPPFLFCLSVLCICLSVKLLSLSASLSPTLIKNKQTKKTMCHTRQNARLGL